MLDFAAWIDNFAPADGTPGAERHKISQLDAADILYDVLCSFPTASEPFNAKHLQLFLAAVQEDLQHSDDRARFDPSLAMCLEGRFWCFSHGRSRAG